MSARLVVHVRPGARRTAIRGWRGDGALGVEVAAPPEDGQANRAAAALIAAALRVAAGRVSVVRGHAARAKVIAVDGLDGAEARRRIEGALAAPRGSR